VGLRASRTFRPAAASYRRVAQAGLESDIRFADGVYVPANLGNDGPWRRDFGKQLRASGRESMLGKSNLLDHHHAEPGSAHHDQRRRENHQAQALLAGRKNHHAHHAEQKAKLDAKNLGAETIG
jgi:hypothetical protein